MSSFSSDNNNLLREIALVAFATGIVIFVNILGVGLAFGKGARPLTGGLALGLMMVAWLFFALTLLGIWTNLQNLVMTTVSVRVPHASIVLNKAGCESLQQQGIRSSAPALAASAASAASAAGDLCTLTNVTILSRLGSLWPVSFESKGDEALPLMLLVKGDNVVNVMIGAADCATTTASSPGTAGRCLPVPRKP